MELESRRKPNPHPPYLISPRPCSSMHPNIRLWLMARTHYTEFIEKWAIVQPLIYIAPCTGTFAIDFQDARGQWGNCTTTTFWFCDFLVARLSHTCNKVYKKERFLDSDTNKYWNSRVTFQLKSYPLKWVSRICVKRVKDGLYIVLYWLLW